MIRKIKKFTRRHAPWARGPYLFIRAFTALRFPAFLDFVAFKTDRDGQAEDRRTIRVGKGNPIEIRTNQTDIKIFEQIFIYKDCRLRIPDFNPKVIVDCGAHIGCATLYYAARYPDAKIISLQLEESNFIQLEKNVSGLGNVTPLHCALFKEDGFVEIENPESNHWGFRAKEAGDGNAGIRKIPAITVQSIMDRYGIDRIDLLKIDIEGAEAEVMKSASAWLPRVEVINIELHERAVPGCKQAFFDAVSGVDAEIEKTKYNIIWRRKPSR